MKDAFNINNNDIALRKRYNNLKKYFLNNSYAKFKRYYLYIRKNNNSSGIRWFHRNKYLVEVVVNAENTGEPHKNIMPFVLFSNYEDAILNMTLVERKAIDILKERDKQNEN